jgi:CRISPR-associated endonuclease/helicase Cas3
MVSRGEVFYAHTPAFDGGPWHDLVKHLERTAELARENAAKFGAGELARLAGLWHDIGKFNPEFQEYLRRCERAARNGGKPPLKGVPHAVYGAILAVEIASRLRSPVFELLAPLVSGHHAGLRDPAAVRTAVLDPERREVYGHALEAAQGRLDGASFGGDPAALLPELPGDPLQRELFLRMVFSALVDADFLDTEAHFDPENAQRRGVEVKPTDLWERFEDDQKKLMAKDPGRLVNRVRAEVYESCLEASQMPRGVFRLSVPTGGGKTRSGLAFALRHAGKHRLDRVVFAVPYTSIIEQTASEYRGILGDGAVLEHHSAVRRKDREAPGDPGEAERLDEARARSRLANQNWDAPVVVTTTVQLFESLFANRTSRCRKLHNLSKSVIVLDEVQTLPLKLLGPIVSVLNELVRRYHATVVLCTATQPALDEQSRYLQGFDSALTRDIVPRERAEEHFRTLRRVEYEAPSEKWTWDEAARRLLEAAPDRRALVVLNTRRDALAMLDALENELEGDERPALLHLSTLLCGAHRRRVLAEVRRRLAEGEPCLLVSTQVVEAGVDLDFPVVFRALGPLDRIVQAAGRCNREGRLPDGGRVVVFEPEGGKVPPGEDASAVAETGGLLRRGVDLHDPEIFRGYYARMYQNVDTDGEGIQDLRRRLDYPEVAARFRLISEETAPVIVEYDEEARRIVERIRKAGLRPGDHKRLQPYVVGLFERELKENEWMTEEITEGVRLWTGGYDPVRGISAMRYDPSALIW